MKGYKLGTKFNIMLVVVFVVGIGLTWGFTSYMMGIAAEKEVSASARMLLTTAQAVRTYTNQNIKDYLLKVQNDEKTFIKETVPAFSARIMLANFRQDGFEDFLYKEASTNPTNLKDDKADTYEEGLIKDFREHPDKPSASGYREDYGGVKRYYTAEPMRLKNRSCLVCHSTPDVAPPEMVKQYGAQNGFGWLIDDVIAIRVVYVPANKVLAQGQSRALWMMGLFVGVFAVAVGAINLLLRRGVVRPLGHLALATQVISQPQNQEGDGGQFTLTEAGKALDKTKKRGDELGQLAERFVAMAGEVRRRETGLRDAQAQAQQREAYFRTLIENASVAYVIVDSRYMIRYASPTVNAVLGVEAQDLAGKLMVHLASAESQRAVLDAVEAAEKQKGTSAPFVFKRKTPDGGERQVEAVVTNLLDQSTVKGLVIVVRAVREPAGNGSGGSSGNGRHAVAALPPAAATAPAPAPARSEAIPVEVQRAKPSSAEIEPADATGPMEETAGTAEPLVLADRLIGLLPSLDDVHRQTLILRLVSAGLAGGTRGALPSASLQALRSKLQLTDGEEVDAGRVVELTLLLADFAASLDTLVWSTWKTLAPQSELRRSGAGAVAGRGGGGLQRTWGQYVSAEGTVPRGQISFDLERTRTLTAALIASLGQVGQQFARRYRAKFAPAEVQKFAEVKGGGGLTSKDARYWRAYKDLAGEMDESKIEAELLQGLTEYAESLMKSLR